MSRDEGFLRLLKTLEKLGDAVTKASRNWFVREGKVGPHSGVGGLDV